MSPVMIATVADVHSPRFLAEFRAALSRCQKPDLFLFAGDMVSRGKADEYRNVVEAVTSKYGVDLPIFACLGNEDPNDTQNELQYIIENRIVFLKDESTIIDIRGTNIGLVGISASGMTQHKPHSNVDSLKTFIEARASRLTDLLQTVSKSSDVLILLMHYSPLLENNPDKFSALVSDAVSTSAPNFIIHGHVHDAMRKKVEIGATTVLNVALPLTGSITELSI